MANHREQNGAGMQHHNPLDLLAWPVAGVSLLSWPWLGELWTHMPTPTGIYMAISAGFMLFQVADKLGWLERIKRGPKAQQHEDSE